MSCGKFAALVVTLVVFVGSGSALEVEGVPDPSYELRLAYYSSGEFDLATTDEILDLTTFFLSTLAPKIRLVYENGNKFGTRDSFISWFDANTDANVLVVFLGKGESKPTKSVGGKVCSDKITDRTIYFSISDPADIQREATSLASEIAGMLLMPESCKGNLIEVVAFSDCASSSLQRYVDSFSRGKFCLAKQRYGLKIAFFMDYLGFSLDGGKPKRTREVFGPWYTKMRKALAALNPSIEVVKTVLVDINGAGYDYADGFFGGLSDGNTTQANVKILVLSGLNENLNMKIERHVDTVRAGDVCEPEKFWIRPIVVYMGTTKEENEKAFKKMMAVLAGKLGMKPTNECQGLAEGSGERFSFCSSKGFRDFIKTYKKNNGGKFCLRRVSIRAILGDWAARLKVWEENDRKREYCRDNPSEYCDLCESEAEETT